MVRGASKVIYRILGSEKTFTAKAVSGFSDALDLAILDAAEPGMPLTIAPSAAGQIGDKVVAIGNPRGLEGSVSEGIVSGVRGEGLHRKVQITAPISPGSSGGPVFLTNGQVLAVATSGLRDSQNINSAVPAELLSQLRRQGRSWEPVTNGPAEVTQRGSSDIRFESFSHGNYSYGYLAKYIGNTKGMGDLASCFQGASFSVVNDNDFAVRNVRYIVILWDEQSNSPVSFKE